MGRYHAGVIPLEWLRRLRLRLHVKLLDFEESVNEHSLINEETQVSGGM